jgi:hypothetical protein
MKVLVACEFSGVVRDAFAARGHYAVSCDLLPTELPGEHRQGDVRELLGFGWDLMLAFPPCTYLARSGLHWLGKQPGREDKMLAALRFVRLLMDAPIEKISVENPYGKIGSTIRQPDQVIHPWQFGHYESKATCLWLKNLPKLKPTNVVELAGDWDTWDNTLHSGQHKRYNRKTRAADASRTREGIARAMAAQWG